MRELRCYYAPDGTHTPVWVLRRYSDGQARVRRLYGWLARVVPEGNLHRH